MLANVDVSDEPQLQGKFQNSTIIVRGGRKIGIIGTIWRDVNVSVNSNLGNYLSDYYIYEHSIFRRPFRIPEI